MHHRAKFRQNWSVRCRDIAVFGIFKMAATAMLFLKIAKIYWLARLLGTEMISNSVFHK